MKRLLPVILFAAICCFGCFRLYSNVSNDPAFKTGAEQTAQYLSYLKGKRVAILANPTTIIGKKHLVDSLMSLGVQVVKVFGPEQASITSLNTLI